MPNPANHPVLRPTFPGKVWTKNALTSTKVNGKRFLKMAAKKGPTKASPYVDFTFSLNHHPGRFKHGVRHSI